MKILVEFPFLDRVMKESEERGFKIEPPSDIELRTYRVHVTGPDGRMMSAWIEVRGRGEKKRAILDTGRYRKPRFRISVGRKVQAKGNKIGWMIEKK